MHHMFFLVIIYVCLEFCFLVRQINTYKEGGIGCRGRGKIEEWWFQY